MQPIAGSATAPLLAFWDGTLTGFGTAEESEPPDSQSGARLDTGVGVVPGTTGGVQDQPHPALTQSTLGKGTVIRIGLPGWAARTTTDTDVAQLTWNAIDVLPGAKPSRTTSPSRPRRSRSSRRRAKTRHRRARRPLAVSRAPPSRAARSPRRGARGAPTARRCTRARSRPRAEGARPKCQSARPRPSKSAMRRCARGGCSGSSSVTSARTRLRARVAR